MKAKKLKAIIEKGGDGGYSVYLPEVSGMYGAGWTEEEAKENLAENIEAVLQHSAETGICDMDYKVFENPYELEYAYDFSGFFKTFDMFDVTKLAKSLGVNASLMRRYKLGHSVVSEKQRFRIEGGIHSLAGQLAQVRF
jgi:predicted RNase H-like HicB family nuclease